MPTGVQGTCIEVYLSRTWVGKVGTFSWSAPSNGASFATSQGGGSQTIVDPLRHQLINLKQANGFLYVIADSGVNVISNVQTAGTPPTTTFNNINVDPQVGSNWRDTVQSFGRGLIFANPLGVHSLYGGEVTKISDAMDVLFQKRSDSLTPCGSVASIFDVKNYVVLIQTTDLTTSTVRNLLLCWDGRGWHVASQETTLDFIWGRSSNSNLESHGTNGEIVFLMFQTPSSTLQKKLQTKLWPGDSPLVAKQALRAYTQATDNSGGGYNFSLTGDSETGSLALSAGTNTIEFTNSSGGVIQFQSAGGDIFWTVGASTVEYSDNDSAGNFLGLTLTSSSEDFSVSLLAVGYKPNQLVG